MVSADIKKVLNTPSMEGHKHVLDFKYTDVKKVWVYGLHTKSGDEVLKCVEDLANHEAVSCRWCGKIIRRHIRKYLHENESTQTTKSRGFPAALKNKLNVGPRQHHHQGNHLSSAAQQKCQINQKILVTLYMYLVGLRHVDGLFPYCHNKSGKPQGVHSCVQKTSP